MINCGAFTGNTESELRDIMAFLHNISAERVEELYRIWQKSPQQLDEKWQVFFEGYDLAGATGEAPEPEEALKQSAVQSLIYRYRDIGHLLACTDPFLPARSIIPF